MSQFTNARLVVAGAIVDDLDEPRTLLAARRTAPRSVAGLWEFPGGKLEAGEAPEDGLRRELREELGVEVELGDEIVGPVDAGVGEHGNDIGPAWPLAAATSDGRPLVMRLWWVRIVDGVPRPLEDHDKLTWLQPGGWRDVEWLPADRDIVEAVIDESIRRYARGRC